MDRRRPQFTGLLDLNACPMLYTESGYNLGFVAIEDLEVFFFQVANGTPMRVPDYHRHQNCVHRYANLSVAS